MNRLIFFELAKMWQKRSFLLSMAALVLVNLFLLWYTNLSDGTEPELSAYRAVQQDMADMTEAGKREYIGQLYQEIQGVGVVQDILQYRAMQGEMGEALARQEMETHPGIFEQYRESYERGEYLRYTDSFEQEKTLIEEIYKEMEQVYGYPEYLAQIRENRDTLQGISIFAGKTEEENFSSQNIAKSAEDYAGLDSVQIQYFPSRGIISAMESDITDILLLLSVFLFAGGAIYEERQKRMYLVIRATVWGRGHSVFARLTALGIHCLTATTLLYAVNLFFFCRDGWHRKSITQYSVCCSVYGKLTTYQYTDVCGFFAADESRGPVCCWFVCHAGGSAVSTEFYAVFGRRCFSYGQSVAVLASAGVVSFQLAEIS